MALRVDPYSLRLFLSAAREGSLARAAEKEHIATSALSRRIADLEQVLGAPLFVRSPRGIALTDAGRIALDRATRIEADLRSLARDIQAQTGQLSGMLRVVANASAIVGYLPERLRAFRADYPAIDVALQECSSQEVVRACLDDRADVGIGVALEVPSGIEAWFFAQDPLMVVLPRGHDAARKQSLTFAEVISHPMVTIQAGGSLDRLIRAKAAESDLPLNICVSVNSFDAVCRMVEAGLGIAIVPKSAASAYAGTNRFARRMLAESWSERNLHICALRKTPCPPATQAFINVLQG
ncbi:LysR family transcriptional regulator [Microvirga massiliensis]|uniref:LysR family transcriptional regulator n=1 Tax=Microvirga massiliensis TaxID=1033741 RepID=UPI00062B8F0A|nr:LysR family transcriptional regulator [Microvirga massiliensis]